MYVRVYPSSKGPAYSGPIRCRVGWFKSGWF